MDTKEIVPTPVNRQAHHGHPQDHPNRPSGGPRRSPAAVVAVIAVVVLLSLGIIPRLQQAKKLQVVTAEASSSTVPVNVERPTRESATTEVLLPGNVQAIDETTINARTAGYVTHYYVDIGSHVRAGQMLAEIQAPEVDQQLLAARAEASKSVANGEEAQADVSRIQANVMQSESQLAATRSAQAEANAGVAHAHAKVLEAKSAVMEARIGRPAGGSRTFSVALPTRRKDLYPLAGAGARWGHLWPGPG